MSCVLPEDLLVEILAERLQVSVDYLDKMTDLNYVHFTTVTLV
jgi:hypothetical protein